MTTLIINCTGETYTATASGAIATWVRCLASELSSRGEAVQVLSKPTADGDIPGAVYLDYPLVPRFRGAARLSHAWRRARGFHHLRQPTWQKRVVKWLLSQHELPARIIMHNDPEFATWLAKRLSGIPILHVFHNNNYVARPHQWLYARRRIASFAVSFATARWTEDHLRLPAGSVKTVYPGIDLDLFQPASDYPMGDVPELVFVGLLNENKAPHMLFDAADILLSRGIRTKVRIIGAPSYGGGGGVKTPYEALLDERALALRQRGIDIRFDGYVPHKELAAVLRRGGIGVVPSVRLEAFGLVALEMLASGMPVAVARTGGLPETVGDAGVVFEPGDAVSLADQLTALLSCGDGLAAARARARSRAEEFTWSSTLDTLA